MFVVCCTSTTFLVVCFDVRKKSHNAYVFVLSSWLVVASTCNGNSQYDGEFCVMVMMDFLTVKFTGFGLDGIYDGGREREKRSLTDVRFAFKTLAIGILVKQ